MSDLPPLLLFLLINGLVFLLGLAWCGAFPKLFARADKIQALWRKTGEPVIGYKRAVLSLTRPHLFYGVGGQAGYDADCDKAPRSPGFHFYSTVYNAENHAQAGTVYLEVIGSGLVDIYDLGAITSHQRVLQVIFGSCLYCTTQAEFWASSNGKVVGVCRKHSVTSIPARPLAALEDELVRRCNLPVVVSQLRATKRQPAFTPTYLG